MPEAERISWRRQWLALDDQRLHLVDALCVVQQQLESQPGWFTLSDDARAAAELAGGLSEIDGNLRVIERRLRRKLRVLPIGPTHDVQGVVENLRVAQRLLADDDHPIVHGLISRAVQDLALMRDVS